MQGLTLAIAVIFSLLVVTLRPAYALAAYVTALLWYPAYLVVSIGTIDISVGRTVGGVLLVRCLCDSRVRSRFTWCRLDIWVAFSMAAYVVPFCLTTPLLSAIENRCGFLVDTWFAYLVARLIVTDRSTLVSVIKCVSIVLVPLAILGAIESVTRWQPFAPLRRFCPWFPAEATAEWMARQRFGFARAVGPFSHFITFGGSFALFLPLIYYLRREKDRWHILAYLLSGVALMGALSSMSSGPWVMAIMVIFALGLERQKVLVKPLLVTFFLLCTFIAIVSNRPFYHVIASYANPVGGDFWHRARLVDLAIEHFDEWWLAGYGDNDPGWGEELGADHTDVTNEFILAGIKSGLSGIMALCAVLVVAFRSLVNTYNGLSDIERKSLCWAFGSLLIATIITWMSVSFFGQLQSLFYCVLGMMSALSSDSFVW